MKATYQELAGDFNVSEKIGFRPGGGLKGHSTMFSIREVNDNEEMAESLVVRSTRGPGLCFIIRILNEGMFASQIHVFLRDNLHADIQMQSVNYAANAYGLDITLKMPLSLLDGLFSFSISGKDSKTKPVTAGMI